VIPLVILIVKTVSGIWLFLQWKRLFVIMDNTSTTSGPGSANPVVPACAGCVQKYTFLGYYDVAG
jgi:hypothetical protein